jgi:Lrp/AsnC family transcriptional regulator for asnA, asnC and gidA
LDSNSIESFFIFTEIKNNGMDMLDEFDVKIIKELEKDGRIAYSTIASNLKISNTMVHQRINRLFEQGIITGIKPILNEKQIGYDWASFTGITLNKDSDSERIIEALKEIPEITECYFVTGSFTLYLKITARNHEHMRKILYDKIDNIPGIAKTDSMVELGCAFKRNVSL